MSALNLIKIKFMHPVHCSHAVQISIMTVFDVCFLFLPFFLSSSHKSPSNFVFQLPTHMTLFLLQKLPLSSGASIHPVPIVMRIKNEMPFINDVMVVGDERQFLTCLMTLKVYLQHFYMYMYINKNTNPTGSLTEPTQF